MTIHDPQASATDVSFHHLAAELAAAMRSWESDGRPWTDEVFGDYALRAFELQFDRIAAYRRYCERRGITPAGVTRWTDIPPAPVAAFRHVSMIVGDASAAELEFLTSGTTAGPGNRGRHLVREPSLYGASMEATFKRLCLGDDVPRRFASLVPPFNPEDGSSLAWMIDGLMRRFGAEGSRHLASDSGLDWDAAERFVENAVRDGHPVCILATTLALDVWMRHLATVGFRTVLPKDSIVMDTGGTKATAGVSRAEVCTLVEEHLGVDRTRLVNEFGMTELLSQLYSVRVDASQGDPPWLRGPPWLRVRALDPNDLSDLPAGERGLLCYFDLANLGSVCALLTEDVGRVRGGDVQWLERFPGSPPRGCSLATAELLAAQRDPAGG